MLKPEGVVMNKEVGVDHHPVAQVNVGQELKVRVTVTSILVTGRTVQSEPNGRATVLRET